jgi:hypothetical protein
MCHELARLLLLLVVVVCKLPGLPKKRGRNRPEWMRNIRLSLSLLSILLASLLHTEWRRRPRPETE